MLPALPMLSIDPALPMLRIEPALPMDKIEPALPMLKTLPKLKMLPTLPKLKMLNKLLALSGLARLPVSMGARPRLRRERVDLPKIDSSALDTPLLVNPSLKSLTASPFLLRHLYLSYVSAQSVRCVSITRGTDLFDTGSRTPLVRPAYQSSMSLMP
jgi:hypothetical protein